MWVDSRADLDAPRPRVSIIIPCHREVMRLRACLASLRTDGCGAVEREVLVVLNGIDPDLSDHDLRGARTVRSAANLGYGGGCNLGAAHARGEFLVFLNDDAEVNEGWLEALVGALDENPDAGIAGARLLRKDGSLQEAGSIIWSDGSTFGVGAGLPAGSREFLYRRTVDYCSGCALIVRRSVWDSIGGFDERYTPAYYEDVDLCLSARALGHRVLYEPGAQVSHNEHSSLETPVIDLLFAQNRALLQSKWSEVLELQEPRDGVSAGAASRAIMRARGWPRRLLVLDERLPDASLGSGRMLATVRELCASGYAVSMLVLEPDRGDARELGRLGVEVVHEELREHLGRAEITYDAVVVSRPNNFERSIDAIRELQPQASIVYDAEAMFHRQLERQMALLGDESGALVARGAVVRGLEQRIATEVDAIVCVCAEEAELFREFGATCPVEVVSPFDRRRRVTSSGFEDRRGMLFCASWLAGADGPNGDGLQWFATEVLPLVEAELPWVRLTVTGAEPPIELRALEGPTIQFAGRVADLHELYESVVAAVVPIRYGAGVKLKAVEAIAHAVPLVGTSVGLQGVPLGARRPAVDLADEPAAFASAILGLLQSRSVWEARRAELLALRSEWEADRPGSWTGIIDRLRAERAPQG